MAQRGAHLAAAMLIVGVLVAAAPVGITPTVQGSIQGDLAKSPVLTFRIISVTPGGFSNVDTLQVALLLHSVVLDQVVYSRPNGTITTPESLPVPVGSQSEVVGTFFRVSGRDVSLSAGGDRISMTIRASVTQPIPSGSVLSLGVIDQFGQTARVFRSIVVPKPKAGGFSWGTLAAAVVGALFAGSFLGGLFASRRRPPVRPSIYASIERRIEQERART